MGNRGPNKKPGDEQLPNDLPQLTDEERAALDEMPEDAVAHWWRGERWDFTKKAWVAADL